MFVTLTFEAQKKHISNARTFLEMSIQVLALPTSIPNANHKINRSLAVYQPSLWGDQFLSYDSDTVVKYIF
jgi:hypothetical protein